MTVNHFRYDWWSLVLRVNLMFFGRRHLSFFVFEKLAVRRSAKSEDSATFSNAQMTT